MQKHHQSLSCISYSGGVTKLPLRAISIRPHLAVRVSNFSQEQCRTKTILLQFIFFKIGNSSCSAQAANRVVLIASDVMGLVILIQAKHPKLFFLPLCMGLTFSSCFFSSKQALMKLEQPNSKTHMLHFHLKEASVRQEYMP